MGNGDYAGSYGPRDTTLIKIGWQQSGKVTWGNPAQATTMQADFTTAAGSGGGGGGGGGGYAGGAGGASDGAATGPTTAPATGGPSGIVPTGAVVPSPPPTVDMSTLAPTPPPPPGFTDTPDAAARRDAVKRGFGALPDGTIMPDGSIIVNGVPMPNPGPAPMPKGPHISMPATPDKPFTQATPIQHARFVTHATPGITNPLAQRIAQVRRGPTAAPAGRGPAPAGGGRTPAPPPPPWAVTQQRITHVSAFMNPLAARIR